MSTTFGTLNFKKVTKGMYKGQYADFEQGYKVKKTKDGFWRCYAYHEEAGRFYALGWILFDECEDAMRFCEKDKGRKLRLFEELKVAA